jgi:hypothetical protein
MIFFVCLQRLDSLEDVLGKIIVNAATLLQCERCSLFMVDHQAQQLYGQQNNK